MPQTKNYNNRFVYPVGYAIAMSFKSTVSPLVIFLKSVQRVSFWVMGEIQCFFNDGLLHNIRILRRVLLDSFVSGLL